MFRTLAREGVDIVEAVTFDFQTSQMAPIDESAGDQRGTISEDWRSTVSRRQVYIRD